MGNHGGAHGSQLDVLQGPSRVEDGSCVMVHWAEYSRNALFGARRTYIKRRESMKVAESVEHCAAKSVPGE